MTQPKKDIAPVRSSEESEYVMGLEKGLAIVEAFGLLRGGGSLTQIAEITGYSKSSVRRCLLTLCKLGYASQNDRQFRLAARALRLGHAYVASDALTKVAQPILEMISERTRETDLAPEKRSSWLMMESETGATR